MTELFRERDYTRVGYYQTILEAQGIPTLVRNRDLVGCMTEIPIPEFFPALWVVNDGDYPQAIEILKKIHLEAEADAHREMTCGSCGESNPGTFDLCWNCGGELAAAG